MSRPVQVLMTVFAPLNAIMVKWGTKLEQRLDTESVLGASKDDIDKAIDLAVAKDKDSAVEAEMLKSIVGFNDVAVKQIMRSRMDIVALDTAMDTDEMLKEVTTIINQLEKKGVEGEVSNTNYNNFFFWFLTAALLLLIVDLFIHERKKA